MGRRPIEDEDDIAASNPERKRVLDELGVMSEAELCELYQCGRRALQNRAHSELPPFFKAGGKRLWFRDDVIKFFRARINDD